jgi:hypothetical protein
MPPGVEGFFEVEKAGKKSSAGLFEQRRRPESILNTIDGYDASGWLA